MNSKHITHALTAHPSTSSDPKDPRNTSYLFWYDPRSGRWEDFHPSTGPGNDVSERVVRVAVTQALADSGLAFTGASINLAMDLLKAGVR